MGKFDQLLKLLKGVAPAAEKAAVKAMPIIDEVRAKQIAKAYDAMKHAPNDPEVAKAYKALIDETGAQYDNLVNNKGLKVSRIEPGMENPYKSSQDLINDVETNKKMSFFPTDQGFGSGTVDVSGNPLLTDSGRMLDGKPLTNNDLFRIVHDYHGHVEPKTSFGPRGEEGAWQNHNKMFSPEAQKALATETRGQNSWVNYGPEGQANRANPANTTYADQKTGLLPDWARDTSAPEGIPAVSYGDKGLNESSMFEEFANSRAASEGAEKYSTRIKGKVYDFEADPEKILAQANGDVAKAKALAQSAGYDAVSTTNNGKKMYETFKPVSMRPSYAVAGGLGLGAATLGGQEQAEAGTVGSFNGIKKMFQVGEKVFPAGSTAEALKIQKAMEDLGHIRPNHSLVQVNQELAPVANQAASDAGRGLLPKAAAGIGMAGGVTEETTSPFQMLKEGLSKYKEGIVDPIAAKAKQVLTPDFNVGGQEFKTSSAVSDAAIDMAADPVNYIPGVGGAVAGAAQMVGELTPDKKFANTRKMFGK